MFNSQWSILKRAQTGWLVQATDYRKLNEPLLIVSPYRAHIRSAHARPRLQRTGTIYLMARPPLLCQGGEFSFRIGSS